MNTGMQLIILAKAFDVKLTNLISGDATSSMCDSDAVEQQIEGTNSWQ